MNKKETKKVKRINKKTLIAALDIGKNLQYGYFRAPNGNDVEPFSFFNTRKGFNGFWKKLCQFKDQEGLEEVLVGFESTGSYAEPLITFLKEKPVQLIQVNPMHTKRIKGLTGNSPNKTDKKDPRVIADIICLGHALTMVVPEGPAAGLRKLTQARERAMKSRNVFLNQLEPLTHVIFPEFSNTLNINTKSAQYLLKYYTTPETICALGQKAVGEILRKVSRGRISQEKARLLYLAAQDSVGISHGKQSIILEIEYLIGKIETEDRFIDSLEDQMDVYLKQIPYSKNIMSIKGIGRVITAGLIGEVGDFNKFKTISEIMKLAGRDLFEISSGAKKGQRKISKRGRSLMRKLLYFAAIITVRKNGVMYDSYHKMLDRGRSKMKALIAIMRKLLVLIFALVRDNTEYVEKYNKNNHYQLAA